MYREYKHADKKKPCKWQTVGCTYTLSCTGWLTLSHPEALPWRVKSFGVRHSKITKGTVLAGLGEERLIGSAWSLV